MLPFRPFLSDLTAYTPGEQLDGTNIIKLNTNENPYPPAAAVLEEIQEGLRRLRLYPNPNSDRLRRELAVYHGVEMNQVLVGNGSDEILRLLVQAFIGKGDVLAVVEPSYSLYPVLAAQYEGVTKTYPLIDRERLPEEVFCGKEPLFMLPNPNPPLGTWFSRADVAKLCRGRAGGLVVIDEAYVDFAPRDVIPLLSEFSNLAVTRTFSKSYSMAGMRIGYVVGSAELIANLFKLKDSYNLDHLAQAAAAAAVASAKHMQHNADKIIETRSETVRALEGLGYSVPESQGNFVFAIHPDVKKHFEALREKGILVRYFDTPLLHDGMRISIGTPAQMSALIEALTEIIRSS